MPVPAVIVSAAANYKFNTDFLAKTVEDFSPEEWLKAPQDGMNHAAWIVGHCIWARQRIIERLGAKWEQSGLDIYGRGAKLADASAYPAKEELLSVWRESGAQLNAVLDSASEDALAQPATAGPPSANGKISGIIDFLAIHETYHVGQASYLRSWFGKKGLMG